MTMSITLVLIVLTVLTSVSAFNNRTLFERMKHHPYTEHKHKEYYRFLTSGFVHGSWMHLGINMFVLWEFGRTVENLYVHYLGNIVGHIAYLVMYLAAIVIADMPSFRKHANNPHYSSIGASGGVSGILFAFILFYPWTMLGLYFIIPVPAIIFGVLYLLYSTWASKNQNDMIAHDAHLYGALAGMAITIAMYPKVLSIFVNQLKQGLPF